MRTRWLRPRPTRHRGSLHRGSRSRQGNSRPHRGGSTKIDIYREKSMRVNSVKQALKAGQPSVGTWLSLGSITASRFLARTGFAWLTVDVEHTLVDWETASYMFAAIAD